MRKTIVAIIWIILLNALFTGAYVFVMINFNPTITREESYSFGESYGGPFFLLTIVIVLSCAFTDRLPGAEKRV
jgi:hypothetical protein